MGEFFVLEKLTNTSKPIQSTTFDDRIFRNKSLQIIAVTHTIIKNNAGYDSSRYFLYQVFNYKYHFTE